MHSPSTRCFARRFGKTMALAAVVIAVGTPPAAAQTDSAASRTGGKYYGPRIGVTYLDQGVRDKAKGSGVDVGPAILQFGWQWEQRFVISDQAPMLASAMIFVVGGAEQGVLLPSLSWIVGARGTSGGEVGVGPVLALTGVNLALTAGITRQYGDVYVPWNIVVVTGKPGLRLSLLTGFNMNQRRLQ